MNAHQNPDLRRISVVLLRSSIFTTKNSLWASISAQTRLGVQQALLNAVLAEPVSDIRHKLCDTLAELAVVIFTEVEGVSGPQDWPELLDFIFRCCQSQQSSHKESGLSILTRLAIYLTTVLTPHLGASTREAQELVGIDAASQIRDYLVKGSVRNAVNAPAIDPADGRALRL